MSVVKKIRTFLRSVLGQRAVTLLKKRRKKTASVMAEKMNRRVGHVSITYKDVIVCWGGYQKCDDLNNADEAYCRPDEIVVYHPVLKTYTSILAKGDFPYPTSGAAAVVHDDNIYIIFGFTRFYNGHIFERHDNSNSIYALNMSTYIWRKIEPTSSIEGVEPLRADKHSAWVHKNKIYIFGGYGPPPDYYSQDKYPRNMAFVGDQPDGRGWNNHLVIYDVETNKLSWPNMYGEIPCPRAAMSTVCTSTGKVFLFGGRVASGRLGDLYVADLKDDRVFWKNLYPASLVVPSLPIGRSWSSLTLVDNEKRALLYGGFDSYERPLSDAWLLDLDSCAWHRIERLDRCPRLWHSSAYSATMSKVFLIGGVQENLFQPITPDRNINWHLEAMDILDLSPPPLLSLALESTCENIDLLKPALKTSCLPQTLLSLIQAHRQKDRVIWI